MSQSTEENFQPEKIAKSEIELNEPLSNSCYDPLIFPEEEMQAAESVKEFEREVIKKIQNDDELSIGGKISVTKYIIANQKYFSQLNDFYEEECHLSLINWVWEKKNLIKYQPFSYEQVIEMNFLLELLYNILNIFELLPIKSNDLLDLKLYEKLFKIKGYINKWPFSIFFSKKITDLCIAWEKIINDDSSDDSDDDCSKVSVLSKKRKREDEETDADSEENEKKSPEVSLVNNTPIKPTTETKKKKNKRIVIDTERNITCSFFKEEPPISISNQKFEYDPLLV